MKKDAKRIKDKPLMIRVTDEQKALLERAAALDDLPLSTWLRQLGLYIARTRLGEPNK